MTYSDTATSYRAPETHTETPECAHHDPEKWPVHGPRKDGTNHFTEENFEAAWICNHQCPIVGKCLTDTMNLPPKLRPTDIIQGGVYWDSRGNPHVMPRHIPHAVDPAVSLDIPRPRKPR